MIDPRPSGTPNGREHSHRKLFLSLLSGVLLALSFPPADFGFLAWIALVPLMVSLEETTPRQAAARGYLAFLPFMAGIGLFTTSFGGGVWWMALLPWVLFVLIQALFGIPVGLLLSAVLNRTNPWVRLAGVPAAWVIVEGLRSWGPLSFPFGALGYALHDQGPAIQAASLGGVWMVSYLAALGSAALYLLSRPVDRKAGVAGSMLIGAALVWGVSAQHRAGDLGGTPFQVAVVQGAENTDWADLAAEQDFERRLEITASLAQPLDLVIWPESATPGLLLRDESLRQRVESAVASAQAPLLTGTIDTNRDGAPTNNVILMQPDGHVSGRYQKRHLVPFGEWVPLRGVLPLLDAFGVNERDEVPGTAWTILEHGPMKAGTPICFESAHPGIARAFTQRGANLLVVVTNDAWFGRTGMMEQHAHAAVVRAVETRRWLVRSGKTGISGLVSPTGRWTAGLPRDTVDFLSGEVRLLDTTTPFVRFGHWFLAACAAFLAWILWPQKARIS